MTSIGPTTMSAIADAVAQPTGVWYKGSSTKRKRPAKRRRSKYLGSTQAGEAMHMTRGMAAGVRRASRKRNRTSSAPKQTDTGARDAKGRIIWRGPRGGLFVRGKNGSKLKPATGPRYATTRPLGVPGVDY